MRAASSRATALATLVIMTMPSLLPACVQATPEAKKMWPPHLPISSHRLRGSGASLEQALTGGCGHSGRFVRDASDRPGGSPVASTGRKRVQSSLAPANNANGQISTTISPQTQLGASAHNHRYRTVPYSTVLSTYYIRTVLYDVAASLAQIPQ